jgi:YcxB-like protein
LQQSSRCDYRILFGDLGKSEQIAIALIATSFLLRRESPGVVLMYALEGFVLICIVIGFTIWRQATRSYRQNPVFQSELNVVIDDQQISYTWARGSHATPWANISRAIETPEFFFLFETPISVRILPKRALSADETALIRQKIEAFPKK